MDPISLILAFTLKNPNTTAQAINNYSTPGDINAEQMQESVADFAMQTLTCYHKTARFRGVNVLGSNWREQRKFGANASIIMKISFSGLSGTEYQMVVAAMAKDNNYRTFVIAENSVVPYNKKCALESWVATGNQSDESDFQ